MNEIFSVIIAAASPIGELRLAIPLAITQFNFSWYEALLWGIAGNIIPILILPWTIDGLASRLSNAPQPIRYLITWRTNRVKRTWGKLANHHGRLILVPFVAIPLPFTGAWSGCLAAWTFGIKPVKSIPMMIVGVVISGAIVTAITEFGVSLSVLLRSA